MIEEIKDLDAKFRVLTGREAFGHVSAPTPTSERWTFHDGSVFTRPQQAYVYMLGLLRLAENHPDLLPYPWDQPLTSDQDLRRRAPGELAVTVVRAAAAGLLRRGEWGTALILPANGRPGMSLTAEQVESCAHLLQQEPGQYLYQLSDVGSRMLAELS